MPVSLPGNSSQWSGPWKSASTPAGISYYYNGSLGTWRQYNSKTNSTTQPTSASSPSTTQLFSTFQTKVNSANAIASGSPVTSTSAGTTGATSATAASTTGAGAVGGIPHYPSDLARTKQDRIKFTKKESGGERTLSSSPGLSAVPTRATGATIGEVFLGIQGQITDSNGADWSGMTMNPLQARAAAISIEAMGGGTTKGYGNLDLTSDLASAAGKLMGKVVQNVKSKLAENNRELQILLAQEAVQSQGLLSRLTGKVANPNLELLFNGPTLRNWTFTFRMTPRDETEAVHVKRIIRFFKRGMAPNNDSKDQVFIKSPNVFEIQFQSGSSGSVHTSLPKIKPCALVGCDVNYTPDGSYMTIDDEGNGFPMTCYEMTLRFSELTPIFSSDYGDTKDDAATDIGY